VAGFLIRFANGNNNCNYYYRWKRSGSIPSILGNNSTAALAATYQ
jgi:hypothetical protein